MLSVCKTKVVLSSSTPAVVLPPLAKQVAVQLPFGGGKKLSTSLLCSVEHLG